MPAAKVENELKKTKSACETVFKLDREAQFPTIKINVLIP